MGENICKQCDQQGLNFQNKETACTTQQPTNQVEKCRPKYTFLQKGNTYDQQIPEKMLSITHY